MIWISAVRAAGFAPTPPSSHGSVILGICLKVKGCIILIYVALQLLKDTDWEALVNRGEDVSRFTLETSERCLSHEGAEGVASSQLFCSFSLERRNFIFLLIIFLQQCFPNNMCSISSYNKKLHFQYEIIFGLLLNTTSMSCYNKKYFHYNICECEDDLYFYLPE